MTTSKIHYLKAATIRKLIKSHGKRTSAEFLSSLDRWVEDKVTIACKEHNGGKKTLDASLALYMLGK